MLTKASRRQVFMFIVQTLTSLSYYVSKIFVLVPRQNDRFR